MVLLKVDKNDKIENEIQEIMSVSGDVVHIQITGNGDVLKFSLLIVHIFTSQRQSVFAQPWNT